MRHREDPRCVLIVGIDIPDDVRKAAQRRQPHLIMGDAEQPRPLCDLLEYPVDLIQEVQRLLRCDLGIPIVSVHDVVFRLSANNQPGH